MKVDEERDICEGLCGAAQREDVEEAEISETGISEKTPRGKPVLDRPQGAVESDQRAEGLQSMRMKFVNCRMGEEEISRRTAKDNKVSWESVSRGNSRQRKPRSSTGQW